MSTPTVHWRRAEVGACAGRWLFAMSLLALVPKCVVCVIAYAGLGVALGLGGAELCGVPAAGWPWESLLAAVGGFSAAGTLAVVSRRRGQATAARATPRG